MRHWNRKTAGEKIILRRYEAIYGRAPNLGNPKLFSEKLYRQMIIANDEPSSKMTILSDKLRVREWVKSKIGDRFLVPLLWAGRNPRRIPFEDLPNKYILKTNHGSGGNIVVSGLPRQAEIVKQLTGWLRSNYYWEDREAQYLRIHPRILAEVLLEEDNGDRIYDYRFWCFGGKPKLIQVDDPMHSINPFYDTDWRKLDLTYRERYSEVEIRRPIELNNMLDLAGKLADGFDFVRVDLYCVRGQIYFGEMTFTPVAGRLRFSPSEWDERLGSFWPTRS